MEEAHREAIELTIPSRLELEKVAVDTASSVARIMGFSDDRIEDLKTAVEEACINAIEHGNQLDSSMKVIVELIADGSKLQVDVHDQGKGIKANVEKPDIDAKIAKKQSSRGWGLFLIKNLMDEVEFSWNPDTGNLTRMIIHLRK